ncbi:uncharacterized protein MICPUCDRAFT_69600 [Micromonas pusilla CCMP1545]|uniref:Predicted protein n=1 Tax=Micromonas pusilla (strain CCMP1545) TaxID=564608 RepID=C1MUL0_MICPC|nr:uncharacterized protein MICPUCDRAFT_69600 [Micromonas pusilla CCMP1545]EEH56347.1 predicted protein [Micromonas pusilla CCMP1545]|eukprot:XP_003059215.1 predicted protein [Micromonas pusilla CCMP1545]
MGGGRDGIARRPARGGGAVADASRGRIDAMGARARRRSNADRRSDGSSNEAGASSQSDDEEPRPPAHRAVSSLRKASSSFGSFEKLHELADWKQVGLHKRYADQALHRPIARGWIHLVVASGVSAIVLSGVLSSVAPAPVVTFVVTTFMLPYWASVGLHWIPWRKRTAHDIALVCDFIGISLGFSGQTASWAGRGWIRSRTFVAAAARLNALCTASLVAVMTVGLLKRKKQPMMLYKRKFRFAVVGANMALLAFAESASIADRRLNVFIQILGKALVPGYFLRCVAVDAKIGRRGWPLPTWDGVWSAHENWHCAILLLHCTQLYAMSRHVGWEVVA